MTQAQREEFKAWVHAWKDRDSGIGKSARLGADLLDENARMRELLAHAVAYLRYAEKHSPLDEIEAFLEGR